MVSNICIDIGNSRIKLAIIENDSVIHFAKFEHNDSSKIIEWVEDKIFDRGIYSTVLKEIPEWLQSISQKCPLVRLSPDLKIPLQIRYKTPETLGSDRIAGMVAALSQFPNENLLIVNAGTCVTYDLVNNQHEFLGGNIAPGLDMRWRAMHEFTASLPRIKEINLESGLLGFSTLTAIQNGGLQGIVLEIEGYFGRLLVNYADIKCILTGGYAPYLVNHLKIGIFAEPYLVLKGLNTILNYQ